MQFLHHALGKSPEIHGHNGILRQLRPAFTVVFRIGDAIFVVHDLRPLGDFFQESFVIKLTDAARHMTVFGNGVFQLITHHAVFVYVVILVSRQIIVDLHEGVRPIVIVGVDHNKRTVDQLSARQHRMCRPPWFLPFFRYCKTLRDILQFLIGIFDLHESACTFIHHFPKNLPVLFLDNEYRSVESSHHGVVQREIKDDLSGVGYFVHLFQTAVT